MFAPIYGISHKILMNLVGIELNCRMVELAPLTPEWDVKLKRETLSKRIYAILHLEGNLLSANDISKIVVDEPGRDDRAAAVALRTGIVAKERDVQQVLDWLNANRLVEQLAYLSGKFKQTDFGEKELSQMNALLGEKITGVDVLGKYRTQELTDDEVSGAPASVEVPYQIDDLFLWFKSASKNEIHPVLKAAVMFFELMRINPFAENNLQTNLDFFLLVLSSEGYGLKQKVAIEEELFKNRENFYKEFAEANNSPDLTGWCEYVSRQVFEASEKAKTKVMNLVGDAPIFKSETGRVISLTERQIAIMEEMTVKNEMTIREIRSLLPMVSDDTILRDLKDLIDKKLIKKKGKTKGAVYLLGKVRGFR